MEMLDVYSMSSVPWSVAFGRFHHHYMREAGISQAVGFIDFTSLSTVDNHLSPLAVARFSLGDATDSCHLDP
jgi:hypothetical protein